MSVFSHRSTDLSVDEGIDFHELNACLINSRTNEKIANCKAYICDAGCSLEDFDAYDDLATIAERLVRVALPNKERPAECVTLEWLIVLLFRVTGLQVRDVFATVVRQPDDEAPPC